MLFVPGTSTSKNLIKEIESVNNDAPGRNTSFEQMLVRWERLNIFTKLKVYKFIIQSGDEEQN